MSSQRKIVYRNAKPCSFHSTLDSEVVPPATLRHRMKSYLIKVQQKITDDFELYLFDYGEAGITYCWNGIDYIQCDHQESGSLLDLDCKEVSTDDSILATSDVTAKNETSDCSSSFKQSVSPIEKGFSQDSGIGNSSSGTNSSTEKDGQLVAEDSLLAVSDCSAKNETSYCNSSFTRSVSPIEKGIFESSGIGNISSGPKSSIEEDGHVALDTIISCLESNDPNVQKTAKIAYMSLISSSEHLNLLNPVN